jgi:hypothetical protein
VSGAGENSAAGIDGDWRIGDCTIEDWLITRMVAPVGIGTWNWLSADWGAVEASVVVADEAGVGEANVGKGGVSEARTVGVGKTEAVEVENCACLVVAPVGTL